MGGLCLDATLFLWIAPLPFVEFLRLADLKARSANLSEMGYNAKNQLCKDLNLKNARVYWNCLSEMYIPTSLWESTRHMKYQIFEAMDAQQLNELMV